MCIFNVNELIYWQKLDGRNAKQYTINNCLIITVFYDQFKRLDEI